MNKRFKIGLGMALLCSTTLLGADSIGGTQDDPLVTKSYVDLRISELSNINNTQINEQLEEKLNEQEALINKLLEQIMNTGGISSSFEIVHLKAGESIYGKQGTEMIIRSGEGIIIASDGGGIQDVTDGLDLPNSIKAPNNNLLIIPREDGRGILAKKSTVIMVRGGYTLDKAE